MTVAPAIEFAPVPSIPDGASVVAAETSVSNVAPLDLSARVMRAAVGSAGVARAARSSAGPGDGYRRGAGPDERLAKQMSAAKIPDCMSQDAFKFDPPHVGPATVVGVSGGHADAIDARILFLAHAALAGHCR